MAKRHEPIIVAFDVPVPSPDDRRLVGKERRIAVPRSCHAVWDPPIDRRDPIEVLIESNRGRVQDLIPLRYARMSVSPFTFLRGSAQVMAFDLASGQSTDLEVRLCGDAHLSNFGAFVSPERRLMFDLNDFDEASPGPFEWDVKRLAASVVVAGRGNGFDAAETRRAVLRAVSDYRDWMRRYAEMTHLEVWYARIEMQDLLDTMRSAKRKDEERILQKALNKDHVKALNKLTTIVAGRRQILDDPPIVMRMRLGPHDQPDRVVRLVSDYRASLSADRRELLDRYRFVDFARKVVGVGSVGTRCWIGLFQGPNGGPLFLQVKEARQSVISIARGTEPAAHFGERVVEGQRMLQATSDVLLGWGTDEVDGAHYYVRQLWDAKWSADVTTMGPSAFGQYAGHCGWALARAHARTGDSVEISGYVGNSDRFGEVVADWAEAYADQTERDHAELLAAVERGVLPHDLNENGDMDIFRLSTAALAILLIAVLAGSVAVGVLVGRAVRDRPGTRHEPAGVVQGALLGLVGLLLAFGLSMAVGRYEARRALVVQEANDIGTTFLRAQLLAEPEGTQSMALLQEYTDATIEVADAVPDTGQYREAVANVERLQGELWTLARDAVSADTVGTGPRLYTETLNDTFDTHTSRVASLGNRVPTPVMILLVLGSAVAVGALAFYLTLLGKGLATSLITAAVVLIILFVSFDLDRPRRGFIQVPDAPLVQLRESFDQP